MRFLRLTRTEWTVVLAVLALATTVVAQVDSRELANRSACAANLRGMMQAMVVYSADNADCYPAFELPASATTYDVTFKETKGGRGGISAWDELCRANKGTNNPMAYEWMLVANGSVAAKQFVCRSDAGAVAAELRSKEGEEYVGFQSGRNFSYSVEYPWTESNGKVMIGAWWRNTMDAGLAVMSDMAPYFGRTAADMKAAPGEVGASERWALTKGNSANHLLDGQNVAFADGHAEFCRTPACGEDGDSLWGIRDLGGKREERFIGAGTLPHVVQGLPGTFDTVMVPTRDGKGEVK
jgi:prepilin-type processing-associated H-X9-DG protein